MNTVRQTIPGLVFLEHEFEVALDHTKPEGETITVFAREVVTPATEGKKLPWLLFLQGGPGHPSPRPMDASGWLGRAVQEFRVVLLDQRGTGRSTPVTRESLARRTTPEAQADYLACFRSDSIVRDAEHIRVALQGEKGKWTLLGQSYGGFCSTHYMSAFPNSLDAVLITGGVPGIDSKLEEIYRLTYRKLIEKNRLYYERYPRDVERIREIAAYLTEHDVRLPDGDRLSVRSFQTLGLSFGMSDGYERLHYLVDEAWVDGPQGRQLGHTFLRGVQNYNSFDTNPIFAILHEPIYGQGFATEWCASKLRGEFKEFDSTDGPLFFTCEMIFPWMFEEWSALRGMAKAAHLLAARSDWPLLYDVKRLSRNTVPAAAAVYYHDVYVPVELSVKSAARIPHMRAWITSEYEHNGLRADGANILSRLLDMVRGKA